MIRDAQTQTRVPAGAIEDEHDLLAGARPRLARKLGQLHFKERDADRRRQMKEGAAGGGMHKADQIAPREAVLYDRCGALANRCPEAAQEWFQADPMFVGGPQFHLGVGKGGRDRLQQRP